MAKFKKGTIVDVAHSRSGNWVGIVTSDFDTEKDEWYPINLHQEEPVCGINGNPKWFNGDDMPARRGLCRVTVKVTEATNA